MNHFYGRTCRTSVPAGNGDFKECGKPAIESVAVGVHVCHYCEQHAADARAFVKKQGQDRIREMQSWNNGNTRSAA